MTRRILMLCGTVAPLVYAATVVVGGALRPDYGHIAQVVSDLIAADAPNKSLLDALFTGYNLLVIAFGGGLLHRVRCDHMNPRRSLGTAGALSLVIEGVSGIVTLFFPEDPAGASSGISGTGILHIVFAALSSLATMLAMLLMGLWFRRSPRLRGYGTYSFVSVVAVFLSGGMAAISVANESSVGGLIERITIGGFLQWLFVVGCVLYASNASDSVRSRRGAAGLDTSM